MLSKSESSRYLIARARECGTDPTQARRCLAARRRVLAEDIFAYGRHERACSFGEITPRKRQGPGV